MRVFISYAYDSPAHVEAVRALWTFLRAQGVDAKLDKAAEDRRQDWPLWMLEQVRQADYVVVVASPAYRRRADGLAEPDEGRGVQFEAGILRDLVMRDRHRGHGRILPVLLPGTGRDDIPEWLGQYGGSSYAVPELTVAAADSLLRVLLGRPKYPEPVLGSAPALPPAGPVVGLVMRHEVAVHVRLADGRCVSRVVLDGADLGEHQSGVPAGLGSVWRALTGDPAQADAGLAAVGRGLCDALLTRELVGHLSRLVDQSPFGTVVQVAFVADGVCVGWPFELLRLPDGRLLATLPGVHVLRRIQGVDRSPTAAVAGPLKILAAVAAPDQTRTSSAPLDVEAEMQAMVDAVGGVEQQALGQVTILEVGSLDQITAALGKNQDRYHVLHLSAHGSPTSVEFEDEDGGPVPVQAADLVDRLRAVGRPVPLVVLSSCAGAAAGLPGLAATLVRQGADRVLAMQAAVTDEYATRLAAELYKVLANDADATAAAALAVARRSLEEQRAAAARAGRLQRPEYGVATLLAAGADAPLRDGSAALAPLSEPVPLPTGRSVRELPLGYLIGRRRELRDTLGVLRGTPATADRFGACVGVVLTGVGGIGKTALAGRAIGRLRGEGWRVAVHDGKWNPPKLFEQVAAACEGVGPVTGMLRDPRVEDTQKLGLVAGVLDQVRLLLVFDDFEQNLTVGGDEFTDPGFAEVFATLCEAAQAGRLLATCRYPLPIDDGFLARIAVGPLSRAELGRMFLRLPKLRALEAEDRRTITRTIGGHPRLVEFVDALLRNGRSAVLREVTVKLRGLARAHGIDLTRPRGLGEALGDAVVVGSRDIVLGELLGLLTDQQREVLLQAAVSQTPLSVDDLAMAWCGEAVTAGQRAEVRRAVERLLALTLLAPVADDAVVVHAWVAEALDQYQGDGLASRCERAMAMHWVKVDNKRWGFDDLAEIGRHLAVLRRFDDLVNFGLQVGRSPIGEVTIAALLGEIVPTVPTDHPNYGPLADREATALLRSGNTAASLDRYHAFHAVMAARAEADPGNAGAQRDLSVSYNKLGELMRAVGDTAEAERFFREDLAIAQRLAQADPGNAEAQRDLSISYDRLGDLMRAVGDTAEAERFYRDGLAIRQRLAQADPGNAEAQRDLSVSYNKLGELMRAVGDTAEAERFFRDGLAKPAEAHSDPDPRIQ